MKQFYFFRITRELNESRQYRTVIHPLPGQTTYKTARNRFHPLDPALKVQLCSAQNHLACQLSFGDIIGVAHEGETAKACRICEYSRNNILFYRTAAKIYYIGDENGVNTSCGVSGLENAPADMIEAYTRAYPSDNAPTENNNPVTENTAQAASVHQQVYDTPFVAATPMPENPEEIAQIEAHLLNFFSEREALNKLLIISQIRDRVRLGVARFTYRKQNDDIRVAYGTRNADVMRQISMHGQMGVTQGRQGDGGHFNYFDVQARDWRCFCTEDILSVETTVLITDPATIQGLTNAA